jgi:hypothetical protein
VVRSFAGDELDAVLVVEELAHTITPTRWVCTIGTAPYTDRAPLLPRPDADGWDRGAWNQTTWET